MSDLFSAYKTGSASTSAIGGGTKEELNIAAAFSYPSYEVEYRSFQEYSGFLAKCRGLDEEDALDTARQIWERESHNGVLVVVETGRYE